MNKNILDYHAGTVREWKEFLGLISFLIGMTACLMMGLLQAIYSTAITRGEFPLFWDAEEVMTGPAGRILLFLGTPIGIWCGGFGVQKGFKRRWLAGVGILLNTWPWIIIIIEAMYYVDRSQ